MDRAETAGLGAAIAGHLALFAALSLGLLAAPELPKLQNDPVDVELLGEIAPQSAAPSRAPAATPAPAPAPPVETREEPEPETVTPPLPPPPSPPKPKPAHHDVAKAKPAPDEDEAPAKPAAHKPKATTRPLQQAIADLSPRRRPGLSRSIVAGLSDAPAPAKAAQAATPGKATAKTGVSATQMTGAQKSALNAAVYRQLKPFWKPPSGADAEFLITKLSVHLNRDGSLADDPEVIGQEGINDSNRTQAKLHAERAIQAVRRAAPFNLPPDYYDAWKWLKPLKLYVGQPG